MHRDRKPRRAAELTLELEPSTLAERMRSGIEKRACLLVIGGMEMGDIILLDGERTVIGRDPSCDGTVGDDGISRHHAEVLRDGERYTLRDLGSTNGVFVDGDRVEEHELAEGDKVLLGRRTVLKFVLQDPIEEQFRERMYEATVRDPLTGAFNRKYFDERLDAEVSFSRRHGAALTVLMFDLDNFKKINDRLGHQVGDQVLVAVVRAVQDRLRSEDVLSRYGGEEFTVIARGIGAVGGLALGERTRAVVEEQQVQTPDGERVPVTISVGVATVPGGVGATPRQLLALADQKLYEAKQAGRNRVAAARYEAGQSRGSGSGQR